MTIYTFTSIKGGVTKTTSAVSIAHGLAQTGRKVLIIDADHQCNATLALLGSVQEDRRNTFWDVMMERRPAAEVIQHTAFANVDIIQGSMWLSNANTQLASQFGREMILQKSLESVSGYHYILVDTPPNTELITVNCWVASDGLVVPLTPSWFAMFGIRILEIQLAEIKKQTGRDYPIFGVIVALDDHTSKSARRANEIREYFGAKVFSQVIPKNVKVEMATDEAQPIFTYAPTSTGAQAYANLIEEFVNRSEVGNHV
jgi:chromosome partitioning protein